MPRINSNPKLKTYRRNLLLVFLFCLSSAALLHLAVPDRVFSQVENRKLKQRPDLSPSSLSEGTYTRDLADYLEDQFPLRDQMIRLKAAMEKFLFRQENNDIFIHSKDYLIEKFTPNSPELTEEKALALNQFAAAHKGVEFSVMLVPNKVEILKDKLPLYAPVKSQAEFLERFYAMLEPRIRTIDLIPRFTDHKNNYLYFKSDHHWTQQGAFRAQEEYLRALNLSPRTEAEYEVRKVAQDFLGSLTSKSGTAPGSPDDLNLYVPKVQEDVVVSLTEEQKKLTSLYQMDMVEGLDKYLVFLGGNYPVVRISTASPKDRRLMILKDSYANAFVPFLTREFNEITMVDLRYYTGDVSQLVKEYLITDILVLYNINTFNDDNSILNIAGPLPEAAGSGLPSSPDPVLLSVRLDPSNDPSLCITVKNNTAKEIRFSSRIALEAKQDGKWRIIPHLTAAAPEAKLLGPSAAAEYSVSLNKAFGVLPPGSYRAVQSGEGFVGASAEFLIP